MSSDQQVLAAAASLVRAFGRHDVDAYFAAFRSDATFCFYTFPRLLRSRAEYRQLWEGWEQQDGFRVLSCESSEQHVQSLGDVAVFTHRVATHVRAGGEESRLDERETIVFVPDGDGWLAVHEHLSPVPD
jgi:ketosteroid isomerase-like protein